MGIIFPETDEGKDMNTKPTLTNIGVSFVNELRNIYALSIFYPKALKILIKKPFYYLFHCLILHVNWQLSKQFQTGTSSFFCNC